AHRTAATDPTAMPAAPAPAVERLLFTLVANRGAGAAEKTGRAQKQAKQALRLERWGVGDDTLVGLGLM
ncbi:MAG TPA: hypothetical protein VHN80_31535, partial [Kineosporiaceae bacterium]|nr:hypothetical protein [Kineosporiaceae bacterium]